MSKNIGMILAGGVGSRLGAKIPKQFIEVLGRPVLAYTIEAYQNNPNIDAIEIVCIESYLDYLKDLVVENNFDKVKWITVGGKDFQGSVINGLNNLNNKIDDDDNVLIHYGASPFVTDEIIDDAIKVCNEKGNATPATRCYLLAGTHEEDRSTKWLDRDHIALLNCPHTFKFGYVKDLYRRADEAGILDNCEPHTTSIMYELGDPVYLSKGSQNNIKITTKDDLEMFEGYLLMKQRRKDMKYQK